MIRVDKKGFYCSCDHNYFNTWAKTFVVSSQRHAPWAHIHLHIFDGTDQDREWAHNHTCSITVEPTPVNYNTDLASRRAYWSNMRFVRLAELYTDSTAVISVDADSVFSKDLTEDQFDHDLEHSWVTTAKKREQLSLASAVGFAPDLARHQLKSLLESIPRLVWYMDQINLDILLDQGTLLPMDTRYSDFKMTDASYIWTGKGERKFKSKFQQLRANYQ